MTIRRDCSRNAGRRHLVTGAKALENY